LKIKKIKFLFKTFAVIGDNSTRISFAISCRRKPLDVKFELVRTINKIDRLYFGSIKTDNNAEKIDRILLHVNNPYLN
jgi:hypothetical protein